MPMSRDVSSWLAQAGHLTGFEGISTERTLELIPSLTISETGKRKEPVTVAQIAQGGRFVNEPIKLDPGLTGKYSLTSKVTLDFAVNPDFRSGRIGSIGRYRKPAVPHLFCREAPILP
ncbi:MAG: hypothetical protein ACR2H4_05620 [Pyrinomonadaceae bacterium]